MSEWLYNFAVYQLFPIALGVFIFGSIYRIARMIFFWKRHPKPEHRHRSLLRHIWTLIRTFLDPIIFSAKTRPHDFIIGLIFLHLLGVIPILFLLAQHVIIWMYYIPIYKIIADYKLWIPLSITTTSIAANPPLVPPAGMKYVFHESLWGPLTVVLNGDVLAVLALIGVTAKIGIKVYEKLRRHRNVRIGDIINYAILFGILFTGFLATRHAFMQQFLHTNVSMYTTLIALHVLFAELLLMWLPFSKFWHFVFSFWYGKFHEFWDVRVQKGVV